MSEEGSVPLCDPGTSEAFLRSQFKPWVLTSRARMNSFICKCCGERMPEAGNALSRNPNICASCSSMADGMEESSATENASLAPSQLLAVGRIETIDRDWRENQAA